MKLREDDPDNLREVLEISFPDPTPLKTVTHRAWETYVHFGYKILIDWLADLEADGKETILLSEFGAKYRQELMAGTRQEETNVEVGLARLRIKWHNETDLDNITANIGSCDVKNAHLKLAACHKCYTRGESEKFGRCGGCTIAVYCSRECQKDHWKEHKNVCQKFVAVMAVGSNLEQQRLEGSEEEFKHSK